MPERRAISYRTIRKQLFKEIRTNDSQYHTENIGPQGKASAQSILGRPACQMQSENEWGRQGDQIREATARS